MAKLTDAGEDRSIIIIGAGDHARVLLDVLARTHPGRVRMITDDDEALHGQWMTDVEVAGDVELVLEQDPQQVVLVNGVGSIQQPHGRQRVFERFKAAGFEFLTVIDPSAHLAGEVSIGEGVQIMAGAVIQVGARIGCNALVNTSASIDHDCLIGEHTHLAPGVTLSGSVQVGDTVHVGTGAKVIQGVRIGGAALVAAGAVVVADVDEEASVVGVPARPWTPGTDPSRRSNTAFQVPGAFNVMISAAGRRVALLKLFRRSIGDLNLSGRILATEINRASSAFHAADAGRVVPNYADPNCLDELLDLCREFRIGLIVPTIDPDLPFFARHQERFLEIGTRVIISDPATIDICNDKVNTHRWLVDNGFPTVAQTGAADLMRDMGSWRFPVFVKQRHGSSSQGAALVHNRAELALATARHEYIAQEVAAGREYTVDVYVDDDGACRCEVPRLRIATRGGEVSKGITVRHAGIQKLAREVAEALPGARGPMNIQIFYDPRKNRMILSEINPRLGGGYPLSHEAGAPMTRWMIEQVLGRTPRFDNSAWQNDLVMLRWDDAVFVPRAAAGLAHPIPRTPTSRLT